MTDRDTWLDPIKPPVDATPCGWGVWVSWGSAFNEPSKPLLWHWCDRSLYLAVRDETQPVGTDNNRLPEWYEPQWCPAGVGKHTLISSNPLHLEPSVYWSDCCNKHGWVRDGKWVPA